MVSEERASIKRINDVTITFTFSFLINSSPSIIVIKRGCKEKKL